MFRPVPPFGRKKWTTMEEGVKRATASSLASNSPQLSPHLRGMQTMGERGREAAKGWGARELWGRGVMHAGKGEATHLLHVKLTVVPVLRMRGGGGGE